MEELIKELMKISEKDIEEAIEIYMKMPEGIMKDTLEFSILNTLKFIEKRIKKKC